MENNYNNDEPPQMQEILSKISKLEIKKEMKEMKERFSKIEKTKIIF